ncbi:MAG TPA: methylmalonyl-CoA mutase family protein [Anaeromyxobacter sp.]|nr:methylmalonyl-CoA mutase family protein [Anaeromyxobacter sp.]
MPEKAPGSETLDLAKEFPPVPTTEWEAAIAKDLKGAEYEKKLVWRTEEGVAVRPYYRSEAVTGLAPQRAVGRWTIAQDAKPGPDAIRADLLHEAGAHAVQELGYALAAGVERLARLTEKEPLEKAAPQVEFVFAVGPYYFTEIAKLRAARLLWAQAVAAFGPASADAARMRLAVRTPRRNKSIFDRYTNLLRVTTEALSAVIGGCDQLTVEPFGFDAHLAQNVQRILQEESHLDAVADPAGGSYYIEALTDAIARAAWKLFQDVEAAGGWSKALAAGTVEQAIAETRASREKALSARRRALVGVNNYPNLMEREPEVAAPPAAASALPLPQTRMAEPFERIRLRTVAHAKATGKTPKVLLLTRGDVKMRGARAGFCLNFFGCAGFDIVEGDALLADADLVVLCSSDAEYLALAQEVCPKVKVPVIVAGNPKDQLEALKAAGVQGFVHIQSDAVETLTHWQDRLGLRR